MSPSLNQLRQSTRRRFLQQCGSGMGAMALASLLNEKLFAGPVADSPTPIAAGPPSGLGSHFAPRAKNIIYLFQSGGPSHLDLFDPKPELNKRNGQKMPAEMLKNIRLAQIGKDAAVLGSPYKFAQYGRSGMWLSELLPYLQSITDDVCFVQGFYSEAFNHDPATLFMNTGAQLAGRPAMGSWFSYGLGSENQDLPAFVVLMTGVGQPARLADERITSAERLGVEHLQEHGRAPALRWIGAAEAGQARGERLDQQRERIAFVPRIEAP